MILNEINSSDKPYIMVFNKTDKFMENKELIEDVNDMDYEKNSIESLKKSLKKKYDKIFFMSALNKDDINNFRRDIYKEIRKIHITRFPYNAFLYPDIT